MEASCGGFGLGDGRCHPPPRGGRYFVPKVRGMRHLRQAICRKMLIPETLPAKSLECMSYEGPPGGCAGRFGGFGGAEGVQPGGVAERSGGALEGGEDGMEGGGGLSEGSGVFPDEGAHEAVPFEVAGETEKGLQRWLQPFGGLT